MKSVKRTLYYYELNFIFKDDFLSPDGDKIAELFSRIMKTVTNRATDRYQVFGERTVMMQSISFDKPNKQLNGKIRCIRKDILPELMNTETDESKGIEAAEEEGLVETTHFFIDYSKSKAILCIEHNQFGSKIGDFLLYIQTLGRNSKLIEDIESAPIVRDELKEFKKRMGSISEFVVKVHKDNIKQVESLDKALFTALDATVDHYSSEYAVIRLKFDYKVKNDQKAIFSTVTNLITSLISKKEQAINFNTLTVKAEDSEKGNNLEVFDLLVDRIKSEVHVERQERYRTVISADITEKMKAEVIKRFKNYR